MDPASAVAILTSLAEACVRSINNSADATTARALRTAAASPEVSGLATVGPTGCRDPMVLN